MVFFTNRHIFDADVKPVNSHIAFVAASLFLMLAALPETSTAQYGTGNHTVTVIVSPITIIQVSTGAVNLNITGAEAIAGQDQMSVSDQTTLVQWGTNSSLQKITAQTSLATPLSSLNMIALSPTAGMAASEFQVTTIASDLILNIGQSSGNATLRYTAIALASSGTGTDSHSITLTIQNQ